MYNDQLVPLSQDLLPKRAMFPITYEQAQTIANTLWDLHRELDKPVQDRFKDYPKEEMEKKHNSIFNSMCNLCASLEEQWKQEK